MFTVLDYLERSAGKFPENVICEDPQEKITYRGFVSYAKAIGSYLCRYGQKLSPVAIFMENTARSWTAMIGAVYSGNFYVVIDAHMPVERIKEIFRTLSPAAVIVDKKCQDTGELLGAANVLLYDNIIKTAVDTQILADVRRDIVDTDPVYCMFTSGSTGTPKGTVISHASLIKYIEWFIHAFHIDETTVWGNQSPFYFGISVSTMFSSLFTGATLIVIPKHLFSFPVRLLEYMNEKRVNAIYWVASALGIIANYKALERIELSYLKKILFAGEAISTKHFNYWKAHMPADTVFANLYGPTEAIDTVAYYIVDREFCDSEPLPLGRACENCAVMVLRSDDTPVQPGEEGELCIRGSFLASGYYNDLNKTAEVFTQNPLNASYPERIYRTGDIFKYNDQNELVYVTRKDFQIKHQGYRIELGEIETVINAIEPVFECACLYDSDRKVIVLYYSGQKLTSKTFIENVKNRLPKYMIPGKFVFLDALPHNANGKIDRKRLKEIYMENG